MTTRTFYDLMRKKYEARIGLGKKFTKASSILLLITVNTDQKVIRSSVYRPDHV